ncbi:hypothetical protein SNE40_007010 [Patella caerulea]|uniref:Uncharacterized protein n=1 Tax=Patella caerulea TaxID=87958 RepID=A0AAN8JVQ8_PATCE
MLIFHSCKHQKQCSSGHNHKDEIWVDKNNILCTIRRPEPFGKFSRVFTINDEDRCNIENIYTMFPNTL